MSRFIIFLILFNFSIYGFSQAEEENLNCFGNVKTVCGYEKVRRYGNGNGKISECASVNSDDVFISETSFVCGNVSLQGHTKVFNSTVMNNTKNQLIIYGNKAIETKIYNSNINGSGYIQKSKITNSIITGSGNIYYTEILSSIINGPGEIENSIIFSSSIIGSGVKSTAYIVDSTVSGSGNIISSYLINIKKIGSGNIFQSEFENMNLIGTDNYSLGQKL